MSSTEEKVSDFFKMLHENELTLKQTTVLLSAISESPYSIGQMAQLVKVLTIKGWSSEDIAQFAQYPDHKTIRAISNGKSGLNLHSPINTTKHPSIPPLWHIESHDPSLGTITLEKRADGELYVNGRKVVLFIHKSQTPVVQLDTLQEKVTRKFGGILLNATILEYLLKHQELIPLSWKLKSVLFLGTTFGNHDGKDFVRCLCWAGPGWGRYVVYSDNYVGPEHAIASLVA
ncbi:MAG: hypothetical protein MRY49_00705 [Candidatus Pacebacteria bacterium]|nr:hypothetical protein [Candidatus Paceibacterota bacterium]